jgi:hypothetical protein
LHEFSVNKMRPKSVIRREFFDGYIVDDIHAARQRVQEGKERSTRLNLPRERTAVLPLRSPVFFWG